ncbi:MAG: MFS transporter [Thermoleophilia bacterium]
MPPGSGSPRYRPLFANLEFSALFAAQVISLLGDVVAAVALTVLVYAETGSTALAALTFSLVFLPYLFAGVLLSSLVDRLPARAVLVSCNLLSALIVAVMADVALPVAGLLVLLFLLGLIAPLFAGVRAATLPEVLPDEPSFVLGRSLLRLAAQLTQVAGNLVGGLLLLVLTPRGALTLDAISFAAAALLLRLGTKKRPRRVAGSNLPVLRDSLAGLRRILSQPTLRRLLLFGWLLPACTAAPEALAAPYVHEIGRGTGAVGLFLAAVPAGTAIADLSVARYFSLHRQVRVIVVGALFTCLPLLFFALRPSLPLAMTLLFLAGLGCAYLPGYDQRLFSLSAEALRGRALAAHSAGLMFAQGVGFAFWGLVAELLAPRFVIAIAAAAGLLTIAVLRPLPTATDVCRLRVLVTRRVRVTRPPDRPSDAPRR